MKQKQIISLLLALCLTACLALGFCPARKVSAAGVFDEKNIVARFPVMSDIHLNDAGGRSAQHFKKALSDLKKYGKMDAIIIGGDFVDNGTKAETSAWCNILEANVDLNKTRLVLTMGNHEFYANGEGANFATHKYLREILGDKYHPGMSETDFKACRYHTVVKGIHFFAVTAYGYAAHNIQVRPEDIAWLDKELAKTPKDAPVFITTHPMMKNTQWGSDYGKEKGEYEQNYWVYQDDKLKNVLKKYPQVIIFSGHLHFPLHDERSIWQKDFTAVGTASVSYVTTDNYDINGVDYINVDRATTSQSYQMSQGMLAEVDKNGNTRLTRLDFANGRPIKTPWVIPAPRSDKSHLQVYTTEARTAGNKAPYFKSGAACSLKKGNTGFELTFNRAYDDDMVCDYIISFYNKKDNKNIRTVVMYDDQFTAKNSAEAYRINLSDNDLYPFNSRYGQDYYVTVTARDSFGKKSPALKSASYAGSGADVNTAITEKPRKDWQFKLFGNFNKFPVGYRYVGPNLGMDESHHGIDYHSSPSPESKDAATHPAMRNGGFGGSRALPTRINSAKEHTDILFMRPSMGFKGDFVGAEEFWMWVDCSKVQFKSNYVGFRVGDDYGPSFQTTNHIRDPKMVYYTLKDGEKTWKKNKFTSGGRMNLSGFKGFVRFDLDYISKQYPIRPERIKALIFGFEPKDASQIGKEFLIDQVGLAGPKIMVPDGTVGMLLDEKEQFDKKRPIPRPEGSEADPENPANPNRPEGSKQPGSSGAEDSGEDPFSSADDPASSNDAPSLFPSFDDASDGGGMSWKEGTIIGVVVALGVAAVVAVILFSKKKLAEYAGESADSEEKPEEKDE